MGGRYRMAWDPQRLVWVLWNDQWEIGSITGFPPGRPQVPEPAARAWFDSMIGPLTWLPDGTANPAA